jgi:transposase InsO family protein
MSVVAEGLGCSTRSLRRLRDRWRRDRLDARPRGRPVTPIPRWVGLHVMSFLDVTGPELGVPTLQTYFWDVPRAALEDLKRRYERHLRRYSLACVLTWTRPGAVWAADFSTPPAPIDGTYPRLFNVRDLASGRQIASLPVGDETAETARRVLEVLIRSDGVPLVLKVDNGSAFISDELRAWARKNGIHLLYSPPKTPEYNGAVEAGTGGINTRAFHHACRHDRPWEWTCDDVEAARLQANETARPKGRRGPTPDESWAGRQPLRQAEREAFGQLYRRLLEAERRERGIPAGRVLPRAQQAILDRLALARALVDSGFLLVRRRRLSPPNRRRRADRIT